MQRFKNDENEIKMEACASPILDAMSLQKDSFLADAYASQPLGDLIYEDSRSPLSNAILQIIFRESFPEIFEAFTVAGSFESYITVFKKIFGEDVDIDFEVPAPGKLNIDIVATGLEISEFIAREVVDGAYVYHEVVDDLDDQIIFETVKGFQTQYELELMLFEMVPAGIFTDIDLTV